MIWREVGELRDSEKDEDSSRRIKLDVLEFWRGKLGEIEMLGEQGQARRSNNRLHRTRSPEWRRGEV